MCFYCKGETTVATTTTYMVDLKECIVIVKNVPCEECKQCGEKYFSDEVMERLEAIVKRARDIAGEFCVMEYNTAA